MNFQSHVRLALMARTARTKAQRLEAHRRREHVANCPTCSAQAAAGGLMSVIQSILDSDGSSEPHPFKGAPPKAH